MARQYDAMVKPRRFNIGDLVLKKVTLATRNLAYGKLGPTEKSKRRLEKTVSHRDHRETWAIEARLPFVPQMAPTDIAPNQ